MEFTGSEGSQENLLAYLKDALVALMIKCLSEVGFIWIEISSGGSIVRLVMWLITYVIRFIDQELQTKEDTIRTILLPSVVEGEAFSLSCRQLINKYNHIIFLTLICFFCSQIF